MRSPTARLTRASPAARASLQPPRRLPDSAAAPWICRRARLPLLEPSIRAAARRGRLRLRALAGDARRGRALGLRSGAASAAARSRAVPCGPASSCSRAQRPQRKPVAIRRTGLSWPSQRATRVRTGARAPARTHGAPPASPRPRRRPPEPAGARRGRADHVAFAQHRLVQLLAQSRSTARATTCATISPWRSGGVAQRAPVHVGVGPDRQRGQRHLGRMLGGPGEPRKRTRTG